MGMKRQEHTVDNKRYVSPQVLSADCCGESFNDAVTLSSCLVGSRGGEDPKILEVFFLVLESTQLEYEHDFHPKNYGKKN